MIKSIYIIFIFTLFIVKSAYNQQANFNEIDLKTNIGIDSISTYKDIRGIIWGFSIIETKENKYELGWFKND